MLVVDDDAMSRNAFIRILNWLGYRVIEAASQLEATKICRDPETRLDLLIVDFKLADGRGTDLAIEIRTHCAGVPILFTSGTPVGDWPAAERERVHSLDGAIGFLQKPFPIQLLREKVRELISS